MKKKNILIVILFIGLSLFFIGWLLNSRYHVFKGHTLMKSEGRVVKDIYYCPMHPNFISDKPGTCPICGMTLVKKAKEQENQGMKKEGKTILYYRNPMNPEVTSPVPMKDQMGMDYVPVYSEDVAAPESGVYISPEKQQLIGVKTEKLEKRKLVHQILTVGRVAYDPQLYVAQEEYLQALKTQEGIEESALSIVKGQIQSLVEAARRKLLLLGMNEESIVELVKAGKPQENLYLSVKENTVWVYITIYEYEIGLIKEGLPVEIDAIAFPGEIFNGRISAITPVLDSMTRSIKVRAEVNNPDNKLRPEMFVNVKINVDLGEKLAVPEAAVLDTGTRKIVYLAKEGNRLEQREVTLGQKAQGYYEVIKGLNEADEVVTSGNFLVDSESKLKSASQDSEHKPEDDGLAPDSQSHKHGQ